MECPADWIDCGLQVGPTSPIADRWTISIAVFPEKWLPVPDITFGVDLGALTEVVGKKRTQHSPCVSTAACEEFRVPYSVHFAAEIDAPADLLLRALEVLLEIAASMEGISPTSAFWSEAHSANADAGNPGSSRDGGDVGNVRVLSRIGGVLYLIVIVLGLFGEAFVRNRIVVSGDATATAANLRSMESLWRLGIASEFFLLICATVLALILLVLLRPVSRDLALLAVFFNLVSIAIEASMGMALIEALFPLGDARYLEAFRPEQLHALASLSIKSHGHGFGVALIFFGCFYVMAGYLIFKSGYLPRAVGVVMQPAALAELIARRWEVLQQDPRPTAEEVSSTCASTRREIGLSPAAIAQLPPAMVPSLGVGYQTAAKMILAKYRHVPRFGALLRPRSRHGRRRVRTLALHPRAASYRYRFRIHAAPRPRS